MATPNKTLLRSKAAGCAPRLSLLALGLAAVVVVSSYHHALDSAGSIKSQVFGSGVAKTNEADTSHRRLQELERNRRMSRCLPPNVPPPLPGKRGIGLTLRDVGRPGSWKENMPKLMMLNPYWNYSWGTKRIDQQPDNVEFVPMVWGAWGEEGLRNRIEADIAPQIKAGHAKRLLGFNEPDSEKQANLSVEDALAYWPVLQETGLSLASPAPVNAKRGWFVDFMSDVELTCLQVNSIAIHWYGPPNPSTFKRELKQIYTKYGETRPLLITEFAPADWNAKTPAENRYSQEQVLTFMKDVLPWMEAPEQDWIEGYSWFSFKQSNAAGSPSALFDSWGFATPLAKYYASVTNEDPDGNQWIQIV